MGVGHLSRCLALAQTLRARGAKVAFICRAMPGGAQDLVTLQGFQLYTLPPITKLPDPRDTAHWLGCAQDEDADETMAVLRREHPQPDWLIVDHYGIASDWEQRLRTACKRILVIDDLADRRHDCDLLLDQSLRDNNPYVRLVPQTCAVLLGPKYALLRHEFLEARSTSKVRVGKIHKVIVFFGGSDFTCDTLKALDALNAINEDMQADIIVGSMNPARDLIQRACQQNPSLHFEFQVNDIAARFAQADMAIGAGGTASWERLAVGLPSILIQQAENQRENVSQLERHGVAINLGPSVSVDSSRIYKSLMTLVAQPERVQEMSERAFNLVDAMGTGRVSNTMEQ
jgi:UDP-2,4-diacetamido-2,4,6-trideoxy-beta-L-altropyranose hydrolase